MVLYLAAEAEGEVIMAQMVTQAVQILLAQVVMYQQYLATATAMEEMQVKQALMGSLGR